jgi:sortase A
VRVLRVFGKLLVSVGAGILLFVVWTLWGTGLQTARDQDRLASQFQALPAFPTSARVGEDPKGPPRSYAPNPGDPVFRLRIPAIDLDHIVVEGVADEQLRLGPGHYPSCRRGFVRPLCTEHDEIWPGQKGRVIVSGHRTTYGAPFWDLDKLSQGDVVLTQTRWGDFTYRVSGKEIVGPSARDIANPAASDGYEIVFTTCNPKFSAAERLIVYAEMEASSDAGRA